MHKIIFFLLFSCPLLSTAEIALNQVGYPLNGIKRFTVVNNNSAHEFEIKKWGQIESLYHGNISNGVGDFSDFRPNNSNSEYYVLIKGEGKTEVSDPFLISEDLFREQFWQANINFFIDCRSVTGTHPSAFGGCPWRDGNYYAYEVPSLLWMYEANRDFFKQATKQIDWGKDKKRVLDPTFQFDENNPCSNHVMETIESYYTELERPKKGTPDIIQMVHWGLGFYLLHPATRDPSGDSLGEQVHSQTIEQFAHLLFKWDELNLGEYLPQSFYDRCLDLVNDHWESSGCYAVDPWWDPQTFISINTENLKSTDGNVLHPYKGRHVPGHSILPNLYMYEVLKKEGQLSMAKKHLQAAITQTNWIIERLDWTIPGTTKGQRGSEFQTILNLSQFLIHWPDYAPENLYNKIEEWAKIAVSRAHNIWDFRRFDMSNDWTVPVMNETGNLAGFPACALSAAWVVKDRQLQQDLRIIAQAQIDNLLGRNPKMAAACARPWQGYPAIERGWPIHYKDNTCARLELCRGGFDASPGSEMYPYNPTGNNRWCEGWINWNASWMTSLAIIEMDRYSER